jgi:hypothetical protein
LEHLKKFEVVVNDKYILHFGSLFLYYHSPTINMLAVKKL